MMNAEQKQAARNLIDDFKDAGNEWGEAAVASRMAALLQELIAAPEPVPVGYAIIMPNRATRIWSGDRENGELWREREGATQELTPLYTAPPAPSVPDGWRIVPYTPTVQMLERAAYAVNNRPRFAATTLARSHLRNCKS